MALLARMSSPNSASSSAARLKSARPRVAHVAHAPEFVQRILLDEIRLLGDGLDITVVCSPGQGVDEVRAAGFRIITVPIQRKIAPFRDMVALWSLWRCLRREQFDVVHTHMPKAGLLGQLAAVLARVRVHLHTCHGFIYVPGMNPWLRRVMKITDSLTLRLAQRSLFVSNHDLKFAVREGFCSGINVRYVGGGIDLSRYAPRSPDVRMRLRRALGIPPNAFLILSVGRFVAEKGFRETAQAARALLDRYPNLHFLWVAPVLGGEEGVLPHSLAADAGIAGAVTQLSQHDDMPAVYAAADLFVHPSYREGASRVLMEAGAAGLPIIATDVAGCREVIPDDRYGRLVPARDPQALAAAISSCIEDPAGCRARAREARLRVHAMFGADGCVSRVLAVYRELMPAWDVASSAT